MLAAGIKARRTGSENGIKVENDGIKTGIFCAFIENNMESTMESSFS
jgi:hypothetical protein